MASFFYLLRKLGFRPPCELHRAGQSGSIRKACVPPSIEEDARRGMNFKRLTGRQVRIEACIRIAAGHALMVHGGVDAPVGGGELLGKDFQALSRYGCLRRE